MTNDATRATAETMPSLSDALDLLNRAWSQIELINMSAEAGTVTVFPVSTCVPELRL